MVQTAPLCNVWLQRKILENYSWHVEAKTGTIIFKQELDPSWGRGGALSRVRGRSPCKKSPLGPFLILLLFLQNRIESCTQSVVAFSQKYKKNRILFIFNKYSWKYDIKYSYYLFEKLFNGLHRAGATKDFENYKINNIVRTIKALWNIFGYFPITYFEF